MFQSSETRSWMMAVAIVALAACARPAADETRPEPADDTDEWAEAMGREHADDSPTANAATEGTPVGVAAREVVYHEGEGGDVAGYLAHPESGDAREAVIMIHEWWGLNENIRTMAELLAQEGYAVLAVDLYEGEVAEEPDGAKALMQAANERPEAMKANLESALSYLEEELGAASIGVIGWCFGGGQAFSAAAAFGERVDAAVVYYGHVPTDADAVRGVSAPVLGIFAAEDSGIPVDRARQWKAAMEDEGKELDLHIFPDVGHAFANPSGERYDEAAAAAAWELTLAFLRSEL